MSTNSNAILQHLRSRSSLTGLPLSSRGKQATENVIVDSWIAGRGQSRKTVEDALQKKANVYAILLSRQMPS